MLADSNKLLPIQQYALTEEDKNRFKEEAELGMLDPSSPLLNQVAEAIDSRDLPIVVNVVEAMGNAATGQRHSHKGKRRRTLVGLAAPQIGIGLRIILVDTHITASSKSYGKLRCFINPEIIWRSRETNEGREGCFSAGPVWGLVRRPIAVKIQALTPEGERVERIFEGFTARIVQHEIDHLNGIRFPDRIRSDQKRHWVHTEELEAYVKHISHWSRTCSKDRWQSVKRDTLLKESA
jgi:peptide deformylase